MSIGTGIAKAFNWAAQAPERPFTLSNEFNRIAGSDILPGIKFGRVARIVDRSTTGLGMLALATGTSLTLLGLAPAFTATAGGVVIAAALIRVGSIAAAGLTEGVVRVGKALANKAFANKVGVGPADPTPKP